MRLRSTFGAVAAFLVCAVVLAAQGTGQEHWITTWGTAQLLVRTPAPAAAAQASTAQAPRPRTLRMMARVSAGGRRVRVKFANAFGSSTVTLGGAHIALHAKDSEIVPGSDRALTFNGRPGCAIGPGIVMMSDPVELSIPALADVAVSIYFPDDPGPVTRHSVALRTGYSAQGGDFTAQTAMPEDAAKITTYDWLAGIDVLGAADAAAIVAFGDSITDGDRSSIDKHHPWPALLAARLAANKDTANIAVVNEGIAGNRVLRDGAGTSAPSRFDRDVLSHAGVKWVMLLEGINDIGNWFRAPGDAPSADDLIGVYKQIVEMAHAHGIQAIGCTLTPYQGASYYSEKGEEVRSAVNAWIRTSRAFDAVVDFEAATRDPENPKRIRAELDPGDHLHPNDAGYEAMANAVDLALFAAKK
jgi:lysophospholipase L1-like esterase